MVRCRIVVPGRVNLIGEHIDYHNLAVLPMAIPRYITLDLSVGEDDVVRVESGQYGVREIRLGKHLELSPAGDWANYLKAAATAVETRWQVNHGFSGSISSTLPAAAGLSSSSALITALALGLLHANGVDAKLDELMDILPEGEHYVGTRGGGMDHAAVLASKAGHASLIRFAPFGIDHVKVPEDWRFLVAHSLTPAEKSGAAKARYNACRTAGLNALAKFGFESYKGISPESFDRKVELTEDERDAAMHVTTEAGRVELAAEAVRAADRTAFGHILNESHQSLKTRLRVSCEALDSIVDIATKSGADGARLTGAGFGGCVIIVCTDATSGGIMRALERDFYAGRAQYNRAEHLISVLPSKGALYAEN